MFARKLTWYFIGVYIGNKSNYVVYSDASATGCGSHLDINGEQVCNKQWDLEEKYFCIM